MKNNKLWIDQEHAKAFKNFLNQHNQIVERKLLYGFSETEIKETMEENIKIHIKEGRRVGNTTRLIDYYIQELFNNFDNFVVIKDHWDNENNHKIIASKIIKRLQSEHKNILFTYVPHTNEIKLERKYKF